MALFRARETRREQTGLSAGPRAMGLRTIGLREGIGMRRGPLGPPLARAEAPEAGGSRKLRGLLPRDHPGQRGAMQRLAPVVGFALTLVLAGLPDAAPVHAVDAKIIDAESDAPKAGRAKGPVRGGPNDKTALWWNDAGIVKVLSLTDEQRNKMGEYLKAYRKKVPKNGRPEAFHETLVQGNWKNARFESEQLSKRAESSVRMRGTLKIDVLSLLSEEQHEMLVDRYPRLIYRPWRSAMSGASPR